jgi:hypothetical protein
MRPRPVALSAVVWYKGKRGKRRQNKKDENKAEQKQRDRDIEI